jgi:DNA polymerase-1
MGLDQTEEIDLGALPMFERMQSNGLLVDREHFVEFGKFLAYEMERVEAQVREMSGLPDLNLASGDQVAEMLYNAETSLYGNVAGFGLSTKRMTKSRKRMATDEKALQVLRTRHPVIPLLLHHREVAKLKGTYCDSIPRLASADGRIRANFRVTRVPTGRLAASDPNILAIPAHSIFGREIRRGFIAPPGCVLATWDYSGVEMRCMAHESEDPTMLDIFRTGQDIHDQTASRMFGVPIVQLDKTKHRLPAKRVGFGIINGITGKGLSEQFDLAGELGAEPKSEAECDELIAAWFDIYPDVKRYMDRAASETRRYGFVRDHWGRIRYLPNIYSEIPRFREEAARQAVNHKIQGMAQGIIKRGMKLIWDYLLDWWRTTDARVEPLIQVHDELLFEGVEGIFDPDRYSLKNDIGDLMKFAAQLKVPLEVNHATGSSWGDLEK